jgi:hypothetical protein
MRLPAGRQGLRNIHSFESEVDKRCYSMLHALCTMRFRETMKEEKEELEEAKELFKEGLKKIFQATKKVSEKVVEGFREGYARDVTKEEK